MVVVKLQSIQFLKAPPKEIRNSRKKQNIRFIRCGIAEASGEPAPLGQKTKYNDGPFEKVFMTLFARKMEKFANAPPKEQGKKKKLGLWDFLYDYERFVDVSKRVMQGKNRMQQQLVVREVLLSMLPPGAPAQFRKLFPPTKWACEFNASITVPFFQWLVGPSEVVEVEVNGIKQRSGVHIKKCRYLENSGCVGMCVNMCKIPTQEFFTNEFGLPLTMNPNPYKLIRDPNMFVSYKVRIVVGAIAMFNGVSCALEADVFPLLVETDSNILWNLLVGNYSFVNEFQPFVDALRDLLSFVIYSWLPLDFEDMSCEMIYGQVPPPFEEDPVSNQPCYKDICSMANTTTPLCPKLLA